MAAKWQELNEKDKTSKSVIKQGKLKTIKLNKEDSNTNSHKFRDLVAKSKSPSSENLKGKIIVIDPGHGGNDPGAIGANGTKEKDITLSVAVKVYHNLVDKGAKVYLTRWTDTEVANPDSTDSEELQARVNIAKWKKADVFVSLHVNASIKRSVGGIATYYYPKTWKDAKLAKNIQNQVTSNLGLANLGIRETNFYVNKRSSMTSSLVEMGFISNQKEERLLNSNWFRGKIANLISQGIENYFK
jgi:N-acetylmuramoyl-L-alanine amidase